MKRILNALLTTYVLTNGQGPQTIPPPATTLATTAAATTGAGLPATPIILPIITPSPVTPSPVTPSPVTASPVTAAPVAPAPVTPSPVTPSPVTPSPVTPTPVTPLPIAPITPTPTLYINPYCPISSGIGAVPPGIGGFTTCTSNAGPTSIASDMSGQVRCESFSCCLCQEINCGFGMTACDTVYIGDSGAVGVQNINVQGALIPSLTQQGQLGATIDCQGNEGCKSTKIMGKTVGQMDCGGDLGCFEANIVLNDPAPGFEFQVNGMMSFMNGNIEVNIGIPPPPGQVCNPQYIPQIVELSSIDIQGQNSAQNAIITINNHGCDIVQIDHLACHDPDSCLGTQFNFNGNVQILQCELYHPTGQVPTNCIQSQNQALPQGIPQQVLPPFLAPAPVPVPIMTTAAPIPINPILPIVPAPAPPAAATTARPITAAIPIPSTGLQCQDLFMCPNGNFVVTNPMQNFELICDIPGSCNALTLNMDFAVGYVGDRIDGFVFTEPNAANGATININYESLYQPLEISHIECQKYGSCAGLTFNLGAGVSLSNVNLDCMEPGACFGCTMNQGLMNIPCEALYNFQQNGGQSMMPQTPQQPQPQPPQFPSVPAPPLTTRAIPGLPQPPFGNPWI